MAAGKLRVAIVGFGFMGRTHYGAWKKTPCAKVTAICDSNLNQLSRKVAGNGNDADLATDFKGVAVVESFDELLARGGFDVVDLTLPTPLHPALVKKALAAGCHVLCEKPMALDVKSCDAMIAAAAKSRGKLMIAQCLRFAPAVKYLHDVVASEKYGKVVGASFDRASMLPGWGAGGKSWFLDEEASGGVLLDLHIHDVDFINWTFGRPNSVAVRRHVRSDGVTDRATTLYGYRNCVVSSSASWAASPSFSFEARSFVELEKATIVMDAKRAAPLQVYPFRGRPFTPKLDYSISPYEAEIKAFAAWTLGRRASVPITLEDARDAVALVEAERRSMRAGREIML
ncbi:MAG: Gfo/Idh/MocA family oxidoreductase [Kiritimatiellae bacterium]|nr:Gfo/Idh/MocA family oxidoreductase [Kiritimatiellia bacterium]